MLEVTQKTDVYTARDERVGSVDRIVIDPVSGRLSHVVVRKGVFFPEDKLIRMEDISTATPERINLRQGLDPDELLPFVEQHYFPFERADLDGSEQPARLIDGGAGFVSTWYGPVGVAAPMHEDALLALNERNIPDRLAALQAGLPVLSSDHHVVGRLERVVTTNEGLPTHFVIEAEGLSSDRRAVPVGWVEDISEEALGLAASASSIEAIRPLGADR
jgi:hypothetical protein